MKRVMLLLCIAMVASGLAAETVKVAPTQAIVDFLVSQGADAAAITAAKANAPSEALFLAPGAPSKEALNKIEEITSRPFVKTSDSAYSYAQHDKLNDLVLSELWSAAARNADQFAKVSMQIGDKVWEFQNIQPSVNPPPADPTMIKLY